MCPSGATCLSADCCFSELAITINIQLSVLAVIEFSGNPTACEIAWGPAKILSTGQYILLKKFSKSRVGPASLKVCRKDCVGLVQSVPHHIIEN